MNIYPILPFIAFFTNISLGCFIIYVNPRNKINKLFSLVLFSVALWSIGNFHTFTSLTPEDALFWGKFGTLGASLTAIFLLHFFLEFTKSKFISRKIYLLLLYIPACFFIFINFFTNMIAPSAIPVYWGYYLSKGTLYYPLSIYIILFIIAGFVSCYKYYLKNESKKEKIQAKFLVIAISIPLIGGITTEVLLPFLGFNIMPLSTTLTTIMSVIIASVIVKHNLMTPFSFGIQRKLTASFLIIVLIVSTVGLFSITQSQALFYENIGSGSSLLATGAMNKIDRTIDSRVEEFQLLTSSSKIQDSIKKSNNEFSLIGSDHEIYDFIIEQDIDWISTQEDNLTEFMYELINNNLSEELKTKINFYKEKYNYSLLGEIFITNKYGANIGQTGKTSDYYQADEEWWQESVKNGLHIDNIDYDESAGIYSLDIVLRIDDKGEFIGVIKVVWNIEEIIDIMKNSITSTGYEQYSSMNYKLLDSNGRLIYSQEEFDFLENESNLLSFITSSESLNSSSYAILNNIESDNDKLIAYAYSEAFKEFNILKFILVLEHDTKEIFGSFNSLQNFIIIITILMIIVGLSLGYFISRSISSRIIELRNATSKISKGNLDIKIDVKSNDEIGELSYAFNKMTGKLKESKKQINDYSTTLEKTLKQKDEFINQLGHDLKNPLGPLINIIPILKKQEKDSKKIDMFNIVIRNVEYMKNLVVKTIALARLNSPNTEFTFEDTDLLNELNYIIEQNKLLFKEKNIKIINNITKSTIVNADKLRLTELLNNLINNSVKYNEDSGTITFNSIEEENFVLVSVKDDGIGMSKEQIDRIFDEFYKADGSRHDFDSSGLGLPICKRIVEKHGGQIWVESEGVGKGSTFFFTLYKNTRNQEVMSNKVKIDGMNNDFVIENKIEKTVYNEELVKQIDTLLEDHKK